MYPYPFSYHRPASVTEALQLIEEHGEDGKVLAGGHSLLPVMKLRLAQPSHIIDITRLDDLRGITAADGSIRIGALTTRLSYPYGIMVNVDGRRFVDEGSDFKLLTYAKIGREVLGQPRGVAYQIFDQRTVGMIEPRYELGSAPVVAPFYYTFSVWAVISGLVVFREFPDTLAVWGILLITGSGLLIVMLDRRRKPIPAA